MRSDYENEIADQHRMHLTALRLRLNVLLWLFGIMFFLTLLAIIVGR